MKYKVCTWWWLKLFHGHSSRNIFSLWQSIALFHHHNHFSNARSKGNVLELLVHLCVYVCSLFLTFRKLLLSLFSKIHLLNRSRRSSRTRRPSCDRKILCPRINGLRNVLKDCLSPECRPFSIVTFLMNEHPILHNARLPLILLYLPEG